MAAFASGYLRGFVVTLIAFLSGNWLQRTVEQHWTRFQPGSISERMYFDAWLALIPSLCIALTLFSGDLTRRDIFLATGKLNARVAGLGRIRWRIVAPAVILFMIFGLREQLRFILGDVHVARHAGWAAITALSLSFAVINAANEEFRFRFVLVARGKRALG